MRASSILTDAPASDDFSRRQILDLSHAVRAPRFSTSAWQRSALIREVLDMGPTRAIPLTPRPEPVTSELSIVMEGNHVRESFRTGAHVARRRYVAALVEPELAVAPEPFEVVPDTSLQAAAGEALRRLSTVKQMRRALPAPPSTVGYTVVMWVAAALMVVCAAAGLWAVARVWS
jgi:hypothetical protein